MRILDVIYLVFFKLQKETKYVSWDREANAALWFAVPLVVWLELATHHTYEFHGVRFLSSFFANKITYVLVIFFPIWVAVFVISRRINRNHSTAVRIKQVDDLISRRIQFVIAVLYVLVPFSLMAWSAVLARQSI